MHIVKRYRIVSLLLIVYKTRSLGLVRFVLRALWNSLFLVLFESSYSKSLLLFGLSELAQSALCQQANSPVSPRSFRLNFQVKKSLNRAS